MIDSDHKLPMTRQAALLKLSHELLGAESLEPALQRLGRVGARLQCQCGCKDSVATCSMLECHFSKPAICRKPGTNGGSC